MLQVQTRRGGYHFYFRSTDHKDTAKIIKAYPGLLRSCGADLMCGKSHIVGAFSKVDGTAYRPMEKPNLYWLGYTFGATPAEAPQLASFQRLVHLLRRPKDTTHSRVGQPRVTEDYDDDDDVSIVAGGGGGFGLVFLFWYFDSCMPCRAAGTNRRFVLLCFRVQDDCLITSYQPRVMPPLSDHVDVSSRC